VHEKKEKIDISLSFSKKRGEGHKWTKKSIAKKGERQYK
jgi:hypothetical protein